MKFELLIQIEIQKQEIKIKRFERVIDLFVFLVEFKNLRCSGFDSVCPLKKNERNGQFYVEKLIVQHESLF